MIAAQEAAWRAASALTRPTGAVGSTVLHSAPQSQSQISVTVIIDSQVTQAQAQADAQ